MHTANFTVTGIAGAGVALTALGIEDIREFTVDVDKQMLKLTDSSGKVTNVAISALTAITVTVASTFVTAVTVA